MVKVDQSPCYIRCCANKERYHLSHCSELPSGFTDQGQGQVTQPSPGGVQLVQDMEPAWLLQPTPYLCVRLNKQRYWERDRKTKQWLQIRYSQPTQEGQYRTRELLAPKYLLHLSGMPLQGRAKNQDKGLQPG